MKPQWIKALVVMSICIVAWAARPCFSQSNTCASTGGPPVPLLLADAKEFDHAALDAILKDNVRDGLVDYLKIKKDHADALAGYLDKLAMADVDSLPRDEKLALYINLYNATVIKAVVDRYHEKYSPAEKDYIVFKDPLVRISKQTIALNDLENKFIRPTFKDPRVHAALNCAARSCPPLLGRAYRGKDLDATLEENMTRFVKDTVRNPIDAKKRQLKISHIFDWYAEDFGGEKGVPEYISKYYGTSVRRFKLSYVDYSWELNITPAK